MNKTLPISSNDTGTRPTALYRVLTLFTLRNIAWTVFAAAAITWWACIPVNTKTQDTHEQSDHDDRTLSPDVGVKKDKVGDTRQEGIINVSVPSTGSTTGWVLTVVLGGVAYSQRVALRRARYGLKHCYESIDDLAEEHHGAIRLLKDKIMKAEAKKFGAVERYRCGKA
jgi:hypothetical protein